MVDTEEYFPRGKAPPSVAKASKNNVSNGAATGNKRKNIDKLENLFSDKPTKIAKKSKNTVTPQEAKTLAGVKRRPKESQFSVVPLTYDQIVEGMLSLGIITKIRDHQMSVSLPGRCGGFVTITKISNPYLKILEKHAEGKGKMDEDIVIYPLNEMFHVGQYVVVKVKDVQRSTEKTQVALSLNPQDLYESYSTTVLKEDLVMIAAVSSEEDHGYVMDVGINGARCFLPKQDAQRFITRANRNRPLGIGQLIYCKIKKIQFHRLIANITLTTLPKAVGLQKMDDVVGLTYSTLMPGMLADAIVMQTHKTGVMVHCLELNSLIHQDFTNDVWAEPEGLEIGSTVPARVLYTLPNLTTPYLTLQLDALPLTSTVDRTDRNKLGAKLQVRVVRTERRGIIVRFEDGTKGIVPTNHIGNDSLLTVEDISKKFKNSSPHECRVFQYSAMEKLYLCSFRKDKLESDVAHMEQALPGKKVTCTLVKWNKGGFTVTYGSGIHGFVPNILFKSSALTDAAKEKLINSTMKARIMDRNVSLEKIILTTRKELIKSDGAVIASLDEAEIGMIGDAIIKGLSKFGATVSTIGGVEGFIPRSKLMKVDIEDLKEVFQLGQMIRYKVLEKVTERNHLLMTALVNENADTNDTVDEKQKKKKEKKKVLSSKKENNDTNSTTLANDSAPGKKKRRKRRNKKSKATTATELSSADDASDDENKVEVVDVKPSSEELASEKSLQQNLSIAVNGDFWGIAVKVEEDTDSESEPEEDSQQPKKKGNPKSVIDSSTADNAPVEASEYQELVEKFERGVITSPNDSNYWIQIMTYYNSVGNTEKARGVAKQGLTTLNYRDEKGKLKIWSALFQLEIKYGTEDTVKAAFADALQRNDPFESTKLMALVYDKADRYKDAERTYRQMTKQFRFEPDAWIRFGTFYFQRKKADSGRELLNEALPLISASNHVQLITKFALLELHHGEQTRGESMLDRVLTQYPQRSDLWLLYANSLIKLGDFDQARGVFHRALEIPWNPRKVKPLLKRFQEFEQAHGTESTLAEFQNIALKVLNMQSDE